MERNMKMKMIVVAFVGIVMIVGMEVSEADVSSCDSVIGKLRPCLNYLTSGSAIPPGCCDGVKSLNSQASTPAYRRFTCNCLKVAANAIPSFNSGHAADLPSKCGVSVSYKISSATDCTKIK